MANSDKEQCLKHVPSRTPSMFIAWCVLDIVGDLICEFTP
jgi:hypothetical protein